MDLNKFIQDFQCILYQAILDDINYIRCSITNDSVFAYSLWLADGVRAMAGAACTLQFYQNTRQEYEILAQENEYDKKHLGEKIALAEVCAYDWDYSSPFLGENCPFTKSWHFLETAINVYFNDVYRINKKIETDYSQLILPEITNINGVDQPFFNIIYSLTLNVLLKIKQEGHLNEIPFIDDILFGIQFGTDASNSSIDLMLLFSEQLNSPYWHKKMLNVYLPLKEEA